MALTAAELRAVYSVDEGPLDKSIGGIGSKLAAAAAAIGAAGLLGNAFAESLDGERLADRTAAALALTGPQAQRAGDVAGRLFAGAWVDNAGDANMAVEAVMSSITGMRESSVADLEAMSQAALTASSILGVDVARGAQLAGQMMTTGLAANATEAFDLLVSGSQQVPAAIRADLVDAVDEYGGFFSQLGYSGEQAMALLVDASAQGMYGIDKMGDAVKELTISATAMADDTKGAGLIIEQLGLDAGETSHMLLAGGEAAQQATQQIANGLLAIEDPSARAQAAIGLFGVPLEDLGSEGIPDFLNQLTMASGELENVAGATARAGGTMNDNLSTRVQEFQQTAQQGLVDFLGGQVIPRLEAFAGWVVRNGDELKSWATVIGSVLVPVLALWGAAATVNAAKNVAAWFTTALASGTSAATQSLSAGQVVVAWIVAGTQSLIQGARMAAAWVLAMGPVGWVIAIVVGLVALIIANWDTVVAWTTSAWGTVTGVISGAWNWIKNVASSGAQWVMDRVAWFGQLPGQVSNWFGGVRDAASNRLSELVSWLTGLPGRVLGAIGDFGSLLYNAGRNLLQGLWNGISSAASWLWNRISGWASGLLDNVTSAFGIASPSKVFAGYGRYLMQGLAQGIDADADKAIRSAMAAAAAVSMAGSLQVTPGALSAMGNQQAQTKLTGQAVAQSMSGERERNGEPVSAVRIDNFNTVTAVDVNDVMDKIALEWRSRGY